MKAAKIGRAENSQVIPDAQLVTLANAGDLGRRARQLSQWKQSQPPAAN